jgi:hypothetical protein
MRIFEEYSILNYGLVDEYSPLMSFMKYFVLNT